MPQHQPEFLEAIRYVVENRDGRAEWDPEDMENALIRVEDGESMTQVAEDFPFTKGTISDQMAKVREKEKEIVNDREGGSGIFEDPIEDAVEQFKEFFDDMNSKYDMGVNEVTIQMMVDEIRDAGQLPRPNYVAQFLESTKSGVANAGDLRYITRRYRQWLENYKENASASGSGPVGDGIGGTNIGNQSGSPAMGGGVSVGGGGGLFPDDGQEQQQNESGGRVDRLEQEISELKQLIRNDAQGGPDEGTITIERDNGTEVTLPANHPAVAEMVGGGDDGGGDDFMDMLQKAKEAGLVVGPEQMQAMQQQGDGLEGTIEKLQTLGVIDTGGDEELVGAIQSAISDLGQKQIQAQQQMSQNFSQVMEDLKEMQEDDDDDMSAEEIVERVTDELKEDEVERLERQMDERFEDVLSEMKSSNRRRNRGQQDPDFLKKDREMQFREKQLETLNENLREIPEAMAVSIRDGLVPAIKEMQMSRGNQMQELWQPPQGGNRGEPEYEPDPNPDPTDRRPRDAQRHTDPREQAQSGSDTSGIEEDAADLRENLGLDDGDGEEVEE